MPRSPDSAEDSSKARQTLYVLGLIFVILAAGIATAGYLYYRNYKQHYRAEVERQLSAIAELKADELGNWRKERFGDARIFFKNAAFSALVRRYFDTPEDVDAREQIRSWLGQVQAAYRYDGVFLLDAQYAMKIIVPEGPERGTSYVSDRSSEILRSGEIVFEDFYWNEQNQRIYLKVLVPILEGESGSRLVAVVVLRIDPETYLYPYLSRWPTPSRTAETLLVRRDGNDALFLSELRFQKNAALNLRVSLEKEKDLPAVKAATGEEGIVAGVDYRGVPVIADVRAVPDSPWFLVTRMDTAEVYAPVRERLWVTGVLAGVLLLGAGAGLGLVWRQQRVRFCRESGRRFRELVELLPQLVWTCRADGLCDYLSPQWVEYTGIPEAEQLRLGWLEQLHPDDRDRTITAWNAAVGSESSFDVEFRIRRKDGIHRWFKTRAVAMHDGQGRVVKWFGTNTDIDDQKRTEERLQEAEERFRIAAETSTDVTYEWDLQQRVRWFGNIDEMLGYGPGEFPRTWDAWADSVHPQDLERVVAGVQAHLRIRAPYISEYRVRGKDGVYRWWVARGIAARAPNGDPVRWFGAVTDITERNRLERELRDLAVIAEQAAEGIAVADLEGNLRFVNDAWARMHGYESGAELVGRHLSIFHTDEQSKTDVIPFNDVVTQRGHNAGEVGHVRKDGTTFPAQMMVTLLKDEQGEPYGLADFAQDITDRKRVEEALQQASVRLEELAATDELTGLANRRGFMKAIGLETERARRYGSDLALVMIDMDGFKAINDVCGHVFGDRALVEVAGTLKDGTRATDVVARYGGDEFIILMPNTDARQAVNAVERIRHSIAGRVVSDGQRSLEVTVSAGISVLDSKDRTAGPDLLIHQADESLYAAKHGGGNVTKTWNEIARDQTEGGADEAARVEDLRRKVAGLSLQAKEMVVQSLWGLVHALEARDSHMKAHSANVTRYAVAIAETLELDPEETAVIRRAAMVHDIGKIAVPDSILGKCGALDDHERRIMQRHVLAGVVIFGQMHFLEWETPIVRHHHECWNGGGYPDGISGEAIPLGACILAVADAFDAMTSDRVYRKARPVSQALQVLIDESGRQFAPDVVDAMVKWVLEIGRELGKESDLVVADLQQSQPAPVPA